jgi:Bacterial regulatory proteins, tetR family
MKLMKTRKYEMSSRAQAAEKTSNEIMRALGELWLIHSIHEITLDMIAEKAGVTVRTVLRKYGSKEGLMEAATEKDPVGIKSIKDTAIAGDIEMAATTLMKEYEYSGMAVIRTLAVENEFPFASKVLNKGRKFHKEWCERVFKPFLPKKADKNYHIMVGAFYAATDIYKWKLLRKDMGYSPEDTEKIFIKTIQALTKTK